MTEDELKQIEERVNATTAAPWELDKCASDPDNEFSVSIFHQVKGTHYVKIGDWWGSDPDGKDIANCAFIENAREDIPALLTEVRFLKNQNRELSAGTEILVCELERARKDCARLANENAALVSQLPHGFMFPRDGDARMVD